MKRNVLILLFTLFSLILTSCSTNNNYDIVVSSYVSYDIVNNITKDDTSIKLLIKPGEDIHNYQPTSNDIIKIKNAKLFLYTSNEIDQWLSKNVINSSNNNVLMLKEFVTSNNDDHFWTDPFEYINLIKVVQEKLSSLYPQKNEHFIANANNYIRKIEEISNNFLTYLNTFNSQLNIYFAGHNALHAFEERFNLSIVSLSKNNKPDAELTFSQIEHLVKEIVSNNIQYLFTEELGNKSIINTIKNEVLKINNYQINLLELHSYHNVTLSDFNSNVTYLDLLIRNTENIKKAGEIS